eukprot:scaffold31166_cov188-Skeletonema_menzelii.AAC.2
MVLLNDEPDIVVGGYPSAPPIATAVPATAAATFNDPNKNIERTTNADGSLVVKVTTTSRQPNGYRDVTIEYFYVPASMAGTVIMSMDATGEPPSSLYLTKMEQQVLPPGTGEVMSHAPSAPVTAGATGATTAGGGYPAPQPYVHENTAVVGGSSCGRGAACAIGIVACVVIFIIVGAIAGAVNSHTNNHWPTPAPYSWNPPSPWNFPTPIPTREGCTDTPNWVDRFDDGCEYYQSSLTCSDAIMYQGSMGPATKNCCTCGGGSTYVPPTPRPTQAPIVSPPPTLRPTQPSACRDTPGWVDKYGWNCEMYSPGFMCEFADIYKGVMGSAAENCCACGGGDVPSNTSRAPATSNTPSVTPTLPTPVAVPTLVSEDKIDSNLSNTNPFRSPSAAKEE